MKVQKALSLLLTATMAISFAGCESQPTEEELAAMATLDVETKQVRQNDYRGGVMRTYALKNNVLAIVEGMKRNNSVVREENPNEYWNTSGYQDFVSTFLTSPIINDTQWFNEEQTDWNTVLSQIVSVANSFTVPSGDTESGYKQKYGSMYVDRVEKDDYTITGTSGGLNNQYNGALTYRILYDCDKDWCKAYSTLRVAEDIPEITVEMFEYARLDKNTFAIQTAGERLLVVLEEAEVDTDIRVRPIKEFYYSKLSGGIRTTFAPYEPLPEFDEETEEKLSENVKKNKRMNELSLFNEQGEVATQYGKDNSIFLNSNISETDYSWVFEDGALQQAMVYKGETLIVTTYNKLSEKYERFIYSVNAFDNKLIAEAEKMVNIDGLVGVITEETYMPSQTTTAEDEEQPTETTEIATDTEEKPLVPVVEANIADDIDLSTTVINGVTVNVTDTTTLSDILTATGLKHCSYGTTGMSADGFEFISGMYGIQADENDILSFGGTLVSIEIMDESGKIVSAVDVEKEKYSSYKVVGIHSSEFFTKDDFDVAYYGGIKSGMTKDELYDILGEGTLYEGNVVYRNSTHTLVVEIDMGEVDGITLLNNSTTPVPSTDTATTTATAVTTVEETALETTSAAVTTTTIAETTTTTTTAATTTVAETTTEIITEAETAEGGEGE